MIELKNISYTYEKQEVFRSLSLSVKRGEKVGILGESGCGKSTRRLEYLVKAAAEKVRCLRLSPDYINRQKEQCLWMA